MSYLDKLRAQISEKGLPDQPPEPPKPGFGGFGGNPKGGFSGNPRQTFDSWRSSLEPLDWDVPLHGLSSTRWERLLTDAEWLLSNFGQQAARDGWSDLDLFGVLPGRDGWGGIAERLRASRSLVMGADVARWRRVINGEPESFARGLGGTAQMIALWEVG